MRHLIHVMIPNEPFNTYLREGAVTQRIHRIIEETKPEQVYFTEHEGHRACFAIYQVKDNAMVSQLTEPWHLTFNADCRVEVAMTFDELRSVKLDDLGRRWK